MHPDDVFKMGSYGSPSYGTSTPTFNNQLVPSFDYSAQAAIDSGKYMASDPMAGMGGAGTTGGNWWDGMFGGKNVDGSVNPNYGGMALGVAQGLGSMFMGMKQYGLAKDQLKQGKEQFNKNYAAQRTTTNSALEDRQRARVASNGSAYESVGDYMNKNRIA